MLLISLTPALVSARSLARRSAAPVSLLGVNPPPHIHSPRLYFKDDEAIVLQTPLKAKCAIRRGGGGERASGERRERGGDGDRAGFRRAST